MPKFSKIKNIGNFTYVSDMKVGGGVISALYHISYNTSAGNATFYEFGILRFGYDTDLIETNIISEHRGGGIILNFSIDAVTGTLTVKPSSAVGLRGCYIYAD